MQASLSTTRTNGPAQTRFRPDQQPLDKLLVVDIETVNDMSRIPPDWPADRFPKPIHHQVVAISYAIAQIEPTTNGERFSFEKLASGGECDWSEERLLSGFWKLFGSGHFRLVSWNGRKFDFPVLRLRALLHGIPTPDWYRRGTRWDGYTHRYSSWHCDVMEQLSDYGATSSLGLDETARLLGGPGKIGADGGSVDALVRARRIDEVRNYCECDVALTVAAYLRWAHHSGATTAEGHDASVASLVNLLEREKRARPHLGTFLDKWRRRYLAGGAALPARAHRHLDSQTRTGR